MRIGVPKEIKVHEYRVGLVPAAVRELVDAGHQVRVQTGSAMGIGFTDADYLRVGAKIAASAEDVFAESELIVKVKEPQPEECARLRRDQVLFTYLHLAADKAQAEALVKSGATCIAYETVTAPTPPALTPMSEVAAGCRCRWGRIARRRRTVGAACCSAAYRASLPQRWSCLAAASPARTPWKWRWGCAPTSRWSTAR
jgi:alanine dehydrogenase